MQILDVWEIMRLLTSWFVPLTYYETEQTRIDNINRGPIVIVSCSTNCFDLKYNLQTADIIPRQLCLIVLLLRWKNR